MLALLFLLAGATSPRLDDKRITLMLSGDAQFNFYAWEVEAIARKVAYGLLAPQRFMDDTSRARFVLTYLDDVATAQQLTAEINRIYTDPTIHDPEHVIAAQAESLAQTRAILKQSAPLAEAILGEQIAITLSDAGFGWLGQLFPPLSGTFTPLPQMMILSPRERIENVYTLALLPTLTTGDQVALEQQIETALPERSVYITRIGGLAAYPAMLQESSWLEWILDVKAHEWAHHYMLLYPLGRKYDASQETRTLNETIASLIGNWAGQETYLRVYAPLFSYEKSLPQPFTATARQDTVTPHFNFREEMYRTRQKVDQLLAEGQVAAAEAYMEAQRRSFVAQGYQMRRLNQAYFAFHGSYAEARGASGADPIGPLVRQVWALTPNPPAFIHTLGHVYTLETLQTIHRGLLAQLSPP